MLSFSQVEESNLIHNKLKGTETDLYAGFEQEKPNFRLRYWTLKGKTITIYDSTLGQLLVLCQLFGQNSWRFQEI